MQGFLKLAIGTFETYKDLNRENTFESLLDLKARGAGLPRPNSTCVGLQKKRRWNRFAKTNVPRPGTRLGGLRRTSF